MSVGLEIAIEKAQDSGESVDYLFFVRPGRGGLAIAKPTGRPGRVTVTKSTGEVVLDEPCPDDAGGMLFSKVVVVLQRHWRAGVYPAVTSWAG